MAEKQSRVVLERCAESLDYGCDVEELLAELLRTQQAIATIRDEHFEGHPILFKEYDVKLGVLIAETEEIAQLYNKILDAVKSAAHRQGLPSKLDVAKIKLDATKSSDAAARRLVAMAKSRTEADVGNMKRAAEILMSALKGNQL